MLAVITRRILLLTFLFCCVINLPAQIIREQRTGEKYIVIVTQQSKVGVMDEEGRLIIDTVYEAITDYIPAVDGFWVKKKVVVEEEGEGTGMSHLSRDWGIVNVNGEMVISPRYEFPMKFDQGYACINTNNGKRGVINVEGKEIVPFIYDDVSLLYNNTFLINYEGELGVTDLQGNVLIKPAWNHISFLKRESALVYDETGQHAVVDFKGNFITSLTEQIITEIDLREYFNEDSRLNMHDEYAGLDSLTFLDSLENKQVGKLIANLLITTLLESDYYGFSNFYDYYTTDLDIYYDEEAKGTFLHYGEGGGVELRAEVNPGSLSQTSFSYMTLYESCSFSVIGGGGAYCTSEAFFYNYAIQGDTILPIDLADLFMEGSPFEEVLLAKIDSIAGKDIEKELLLDNYEITPAGLVFYEVEDYFFRETTEEILVPYSTIKDIIKKDGLLGGFDW